MQQTVLKKAILAANFVAIAIIWDFITKFIPFSSMPFGGSFIGLSMLPLVLIGLFFGPLQAAIAAFVYGLVTYLIDGYGFWNPYAVILDYGLGFMAYAVAAFFRDGMTSKKNFVLAVICASSLRLLFSTISGALFYADLATVSSNDTTLAIFNFLGGSALMYSLAYNLLYITSTSILTIYIGLAVYNRIKLLYQNFVDSN
jgi:thiamine transporter